MRNDSCAVVIVKVLLVALAGTLVLSAVSELAPAIVFFAGLFMGLFMAGWLE